MGLLTEKVFYYHFGNQRRGKQSLGWRKTYVCYKLKLLNDTVDQGSVQNKVPGGRGSAHPVSGDNSETPGLSDSSFPGRLRLLSIRGLCRSPSPQQDAPPAPL